MGVITVIAVIIGTSLLMLLVMHIIGIFINPEKKTSNMIKILGAKEDLWELITDVEKTPGLVKSNTVATYLPPSDDGIKRWIENYQDKNMPSIVYKVAIENPPNHLRWVIEEQGKLGFGGIWDIQLESDGDGTLVKIKQTSVIYKPLIRFLSLFSKRSGKITAYLNGLSEYIGKLPLRTDKNTR